MVYQEPAEYYRERRRKQAQPKWEQQVVGTILGGIGTGIVWLVSRILRLDKLQAKRGRNQLLSAAAAERLAGYWQGVETKALSAETRDLAIAEADKLLDSALQQLGMSGDSMGERLKAGQSLFSDRLYEQIWQAHKLRNRLAHEVGLVVSEHEVRSALQTFQWALRELGVFK